MARPPMRGEPLPVRSDKQCPDVIRQKGARPLNVLVLSDTFYGDFVHFGGMTLPHIKDTPCRYCAELKQKPRWEGFLAVWSDYHKGEQVLAISEGGARQLLRLLVEHKTLRGCRLCLYRKDTEKPNSPLLVKLLDRIEAPNLRKAFDVRDSLAKLLGVNEGYFLSDGYRQAAKLPLAQTGRAGLPTGFVNPADLFKLPGA